MNILKPVYYDQFKCIANECKDSCCIGWRIDVDKKSFNKYRKIKGEFGTNLNKYVSRNRNAERDSDYAKINLVDAKCPFLNEGNLCDMYIHLGEEYLCDTCKVYPRFIYKYTDRCERVLTLSCPEVAVLLIKSEEPLAFSMEEEALSELDYSYMENLKYSQALHDLLWETRGFLIDIAQFREVPLWMRLVFIKMTEGKVQKLIKSNTYHESEQIFESLRDVIQDKETINKLVEVNTSRTVKTSFIKALLNARCNLALQNHTFLKFVEEIQELFKDTGDAEEEITQLEKEFDVYFAEKEYMLEHYVVYNIYGNAMRALLTKDLNKEIIRLIISYAVIKEMLVARWYSKGKQLEDMDVVDAFYCFSRAMEHNENFITEIYKEIKEEAYDTLATVTVLVR